MTQVLLQEAWDDLGLPYGGSPMGQVGQVVFHHTPGQDGQGVLATALTQVRQILRSHVYGNGWADIGYTWLVSGDYVFEGRGWGRTGAHAPGANSSAIGIAFILDGRERGPTPLEWASAGFIIRKGIELGYVSPGPTVFGHRDFVETECPAALVYHHWPAGLAEGPTDQVLVVPPPEPPPLPKRRRDAMRLTPRVTRQGAPIEVSFPGYDGPCWAFDVPHAPDGAVLTVAHERQGERSFNAKASFNSGLVIEDAQEVEWGRPAVFAVRQPGYATVVVPADDRLAGAFRVDMV